MPDHRLHRSSVWVEAGNGAGGGGVVVHSSAAHGSYVLTAHHVLAAGNAGGARVGAFRHSLRSPERNEPEYRRYPIEVVATRFLIDRSVDAALAGVDEALGDLLRAARSPAELPRLTRLHGELRGARRDVERARSAEQAGAALDRVHGAFTAADVAEYGEETGRATSLAAASVGADPALELANRLFEAQGELADVLARWKRGGFVFHDAALVRLRTDRLFHVAIAAERPPVVGERVGIATVWPEGEPLVRTLTMAGRADRPDELEVVGLLRAGNSGSPVFREDRLVGIAVRGTGESVPDEATYSSGTFVSIAAIRSWLASRGLDRLLASKTD
jgi:hypothetical protein